MPCIQRCLDYHTNCKAMSADRAAATCALTAGANNSNTDANCFCGDPALAAASPYDFCDGPCAPLSNCGLAVSCAPASVSDLRYCTVLNGMNVTAIADARAADASTSAMFEALRASGQVADTADCRAKHAAFFCPQAVTGCSTGAAATSAGFFAIRTSLLPCLQRCLDYQTSCLGAASEAAAAACELTAGIENTASNADCFCGSGGGTVDAEAAADATAVGSARPSRRAGGPSRVRRAPCRACATARPSTA